MGKNAYSVYKHTSPTNKVYIGITNQNPPSKRWKNGEGYYHNSYFENAIKKYGWDNFRHDIICTGLSGEEAAAKEIELINKYKSNQKKYGYNLSNGGGGRIGIPHTEETKKKMSEAALGKVKSEEHRKNLSLANKIRFQDPEQRARLVALRKGYKYSKEERQKLGESHKGFHFTEDSKRKMSESAKKSWTYERRKSAGKAVDQFDLDGNYIQTFISTREAQRALGANSSHISSCCRGKRKTAYKFIWRYSNEEN